jgi:hypothetical protein
MAHETLVWQALGSRVKLQAKGKSAQPLAAARRERLALTRIALSETQ